ncbi:MAG: sensor signal transduction histidine kinase [Thermoleophilia bacterium]|nr:sensor signal transduction histidine kinase [Thermoleophilia bacterium]
MISQGSKCLTLLSVWRPALGAGSEGAWPHRHMAWPPAAALPDGFTLSTRGSGATLVQMDHPRLLRTPGTEHWSVRSSRFMLPLVTVLLLVGAIFLALAWTEGRDAIAVADRKDDQQAARYADGVEALIERRWTDLEYWASVHKDVTQPGREAALRDRLEARAGQDAEKKMVAWVVVRPNGSIAAIGERNPGEVAGSGIADDIRVFGRSVVARGTNAVSGRLRFGNDAAFAVGVPLTRGKATGAAATDGALVMVQYIAHSAFPILIPPAKASDVDALSLVDPRGRTLTGRPAIDEEDRIVQQVGETGWTIQLTREPARSFLPEWTYPAFAFLLVAFALAYSLQEASKRRLRQVGDQRVQQVRTLYMLASRVLHARTMREQAELLARHVLDLVEVTGARVRFATTGDDAGIIAGSARPGDREYRVAITGPRHPVGELVAYRAGYVLDAEERSVLQTAATLVGAAMHTTEALETERTTASELQRLDELRSNLLATVAHELRSPLTAVKGVLGLLAMQDDLGMRGREYVEVATERTDRLVALIQDLFDCSLLETGQLDIRPQRQLAGDLLESALGAQTATLGGKLILSATPNLMITVDPVRFDQLVNNLVTNALRHGAPPIEVSVRPWKDGAMVIVSDEGPGIPAADREQIFGKFWQGSTGHARLVEGAGLGLSLVHGLVRLHGGRIDIDSTHADGRGARFTAYFPDVVPGMALEGQSEPANIALDPISRII